MKKIFSFFIGFIILFLIYHFPEFFSAFWIMATFKIGFVIAAFIVGRLQGLKGLRGYGLGFNRTRATQLGAGLLTGLLFFALSVFISVLLDYENITEMMPFKMAIKKLPLLLWMTAVPSIAEDILTRGYLYAHLKFMKPTQWILLSSAVYVLNHIWRLNDGAAVLSYLFVLGVVLAFAVWITKSLWFAFGIHWGANIAFESSNSIIHMRNLVADDRSTWILAIVWALLLAVLFLFNRNKFSNIVVPNNS